MTKFKVQIYTTSSDLLLQCIMDEFALEEITNLEGEGFLKIDDDTLDKTYLLNVSQIVAIEWEIINEE